MEEATGISCTGRNSHQMGEHLEEEKRTFYFFSIGSENGEVDGYKSENSRQKCRGRL
jgi:hypothetical protein